MSDGRTPFLSLVWLLLIGGFTQLGLDARELANDEGVVRRLLRDRLAFGDRLGHAVPATPPPDSP